MVQSVWTLDDNTTSIYYSPTIDETMKNSFINNECYLCNSFKKILNYMKVKEFESIPVGS